MVPRGAAGAGGPHHAGVSPARRLLLSCLAVAVGVVVAVAVIARVLGSSGTPARAAQVAQDVPGAVVLVPGYGGATGALEVLAERLRTDGRTALVVDLPGDGTGDLREAARAVAGVVDAALASGSPSVDLVGYSAGGVVARLLLADEPDAAVRRVVTLGSPHQGSRLAGLGARFSPGSCPEACRQLVPGNDLLDELEQTPDGPAWLSLWTELDEVVTPPDSARLDGATNVVLQDVCPGTLVGHGQLPSDPGVQGVVLAALAAGPLAVPASCPA